MTSSISVTWITPDNEKVVRSVSVGVSLMEAALTNGVDGITGECGGALACATCHVFVEGTPAPLPEPDEIERDMIEFAPVPAQSNSRLSCQIKAAPELDGIVLRVPS